MAACPSCGEANPAHARFCLACGAPLEERAAPREMRKTVTIVFTDVIDSTPLGERSTRRRTGASSRATSSRSAACSSSTVARSRSSSATQSWPRSASRSCTRTTRCGPFAPPARCARRSPALNEELRAEYGIELGDPNRHQHRRGRRRRSGRRPRIRHRRGGRRRAAPRSGGEPRRDPDRRARPTGSCATRCSSSRSIRST